jgi:dihydroxy-acid dehydratase
MLPDSEIQKRREALEAAGGYSYPASQTPWQDIQRKLVTQMDTGSILGPAAAYQRIASSKGIPRHNH